MAKVLRRSIDTDGNTICTFDENPNLNTLIYDIEFPDGAVKQYTANVITGNALMQVVSNGYTSCLLDTLVLPERDINLVFWVSWYFPRGRATLFQKKMPMLQQQGEQGSFGRQQLVESFSV